MLCVCVRVWKQNLQENSKEIILEGNKCKIKRRKLQRSVCVDIHERMCA